MFDRLKQSVLFGLLVFVLATPLPAGDPITPDLLLEGYQKYLRAFDGRFCVVAANKYVTQTLRVDGRRRAWCESNTAGVAVLQVVYDDRTKTNSLNVLGTGGEEPPSVISYLSPLDRAQRLIVAEGVIGPLCGYVEFYSTKNGISRYAYLPDMLEKMTLRLESKKNAEAVHVLVGEDGKTKLEIHLDTSKGFCPLRISLQKKTPPPGNIGGVTVDFKDVVETDGRFRPSRIARQASITKGVRFLPDGAAVYVPTARVAEESHKMVEVNFNPEFLDSDFDVTIKIPNGTPVYMQDADDLPFEWRNGEICLLFDPTY